MKDNSIGNKKKANTVKETPFNTLSLLKQWRMEYFTLSRRLILQFTWECGQHISHLKQ